MYQSLELFLDDARACGDDYYTDDSLTPRKLEAACKIYQRASAGTKLKDVDDNVVDFGITIVGRLARRSDNGAWIPSDEAFPSIDVIMQENLKTMGEGADDRGSLLDAKDWSLLANDAWVLGGIHARTEFHFASPLRWANLWADKGAMTITARETICITACGYEIVRPNPKLEAVAVCTDAPKANEASLLLLKSAVLTCRDLEGMQQFYRRIPEAARQ